LKKENHRNSNTPPHKKKKTPKTKKKKKKKKKKQTVAFEDCRSPEKRGAPIYCGKRRKGKAPLLEEGHLLKEQVRSLITPNRKM